MRAVQLALFPEAVDVRPLDPRAVAGPGTRVRGVWLVRYPHECARDRDPAPHRVFADRHGWSCEAHGPRCRAVAAARGAADGATADRTGAARGRAPSRAPATAPPPSGVPA